MRPNLESIMRTKHLTLDDVVELIETHVNNAYDAYIPITGREGKGKSHLSIQLLCKLLRLDVNNPDHLPRILAALSNNVRYAEDCSVLKVLDFYLKKAQDKGCYIFDEAERMASKYDSTRLEARVIRKYWTLSRKRKIVSLMNMPMLQNFDIYMRSGRAFMALQCVSKLSADKAVAVVLYGDEDSSDAFYLRRYEKLKEKNKRPILAMTPEEKIKLWARLPSFAGILTYPPLPPVIEQEYMKLANTPRQYHSLMDDLREETSYAQLYRGFGYNSG